MGVVYMAEQEEPIRRRVALKIIKPGMDSAQVIARFEVERQALALMDHPNIARVLDAGTVDSGRWMVDSEKANSAPSTVHHPPSTCAGRPYFVMELVHGVPITQYCDANKLSPRERLDCSCPSARRSSTRTRKASSIATSSRPTSWSRSTTASRCPR
jgi:serine/threonine protein kinase